MHARQGFAVSGRYARRRRALVFTRCQPSLSLICNNLSRVTAREEQVKHSYTYFAYIFWTSNGHANTSICGLQTWTLHTETCWWTLLQTDTIPSLGLDSLTIPRSSDILSALTFHHLDGEGGGDGSEGAASKSTTEESQFSKKGQLVSQVLVRRNLSSVPLWSVHANTTEVTARTVHSHTEGYIYTPGDGLYPRRLAPPPRRVPCVYQRCAGFLIGGAT
ncbi:uncharacterized protein CC84DRAFT_64154 [Paraphaeosphaeria sporulosa]|uniref:Uncharacterized protein n=1 Tax=Paraphaeosphaeria sporulosa TaxID=1460663 RepID=A0A177CZ67_9PLEO|nr:uncharacterized protein CC84DRAFT_64154 [Paraphaeosphaeria sporulosa]OAG11979.1 hypothetical protein CC84DRAFT_64154 [Paraphaeosphaeria sporulosa]